MAALTNSTKKFEYSPFAKKSKEAANKRFTKRKSSSKSLISMFERESISMLTNDASISTLNQLNDSVFNTSLQLDPENQINKRFKSIATTNNDKNKLRMISWEDENANGSILSQGQTLLPPDWDDTAARSSFDSPFISGKETLNKRITNVYPIDFSHLNNLCLSKTKHSANPSKFTSTKLPKDVRLGTKLRLVSDKPFPWLEKLSTPGVYPVNNYIRYDDYESAMDMVRVIDLQTPTCSQSDHTQTSSLVFLQAAAIYHQYPAIGLVQLFPRRNIGSKSALKSANFQLIEGNFMEDLNRHWLEAFSYLFYCWLSGSRKSFYLCSPQFTFYFANLPAKKCSTTKTPQKRERSNAKLYSPLSKNRQNIPASPSPLKNTNAAKSPRKKLQQNILATTPSKEQLEQTIDQRQLIVITPTTAGFRQILQKNEINFTLIYKVEFVDLSQEECPKDFLPTDADAEMDHDEWLKDMGISPKTTLRLKCSASELDAHTHNHNDGDSSSGGSSRVPIDVSINTRDGNGNTPPADATSRSTIIISGAKSVEALFKLLKAQPHLINTKTGPQTGLPPTLISHSPFRHSRQNELSMTSQLIKKSGQLKYVLEMEHGPVMHSAVNLLFEFLQRISSSTQCKSKSSYPHLKSDNQIQIQVFGRHQCNGMNEALDSDGLGNFNELEWDGNNFEFI